MQKGTPKATTAATPEAPKVNRGYQPSTTVANLPRVGPAPAGPTIPTFAGEGVYWNAFNPACVEIFGSKLVPAPKKVTSADGVNAMSVTSDKRPDPTAAFLDWQRRGYTVVPWDVDGEGTSYIVQ